MHGVEVVPGRVAELELARKADGLLHGGIPTGRADSIGDAPGVDLSLDLGGEGEEDGAVVRC